MTKPRLLLVEDESHLAIGLKLNFELEGYEVDVAKSGREAGQFLLQSPAYAVLILDVMLPDTSGFELCRKIREAGNITPVLMLTALSKAEDRVMGLDVGADDYLSKPFELSELLARVRSLIRRQQWQKSPETQARLTFGNAVINFDTHEVRVNDKLLQLTQLELDLLQYLARHSGRVISREELLEHVWHLGNYPHSRTVDNFMMRLRKYFEPNAAKPRHFMSVRGAGYKFMP